uniref:Fungal lipase-type domain-containing protein n=1 Tax=viral metagenome TaxID=1070528 RepID=A0A6C0AD48_9ZZZZ
MSEILIIHEMLKYATDIYSIFNKATYFFSDDETDLQVGIYVDDKNKKITISFRGTESVRDGITDLNVIKIVYDSKIKVHRGFYKQLFHSKIYNDFYSKLKLLIEDKKNYVIYVTGHSLGAALSSLFSYRLSNDYDIIVNNINFASPRVGNIYWKQSFNSKENIKALRVVVSSDPIPLTPSLNYRHVGKLLKLNNGNILYYINDHRIKMYDELIKKNIM